MNCIFVMMIHFHSSSETTEKKNHQQFVVSSSQNVIEMTNNDKETESASLALDTIPLPPGISSMDELNRIEIANSNIINSDSKKRSAQCDEVDFQAKKIKTKKILPPRPPGPPPVAAFKN